MSDHSQNAYRSGAPPRQSMWVQHPVTWPSHDNRAPTCQVATPPAALGPEGPTLIIFTLLLSILWADTTLMLLQPLYVCLFVVRVRVQLYAPLFQVSTLVPSRPSSCWQLDSCDLVVSISISSAPTVLYFFSLIIIILFPFLHAY